MQNPASKQICNWLDCVYIESGILVLALKEEEVCKYVKKQNPPSVAMHYDPCCLVFNPLYNNNLLLITITCKLSQVNAFQQLNCESKDSIFIFLVGNVYENDNSCPAHGDF